jgi:ketosteroid isomerase-like protein
LVLIAFVAITVAAKCSDADKMTLKKMDKAWGDANQARDKAALGAILSDHFANFNLSGTTGKKVAMGNLDGPAPPANGNVVTSDNYIISCSGNTAVMTHRVEIRTKDAVNYSRSVHVFQKSGNTWQVISTASHPLNEVGGATQAQDAASVRTAIERHYAAIHAREMPKVWEHHLPDFTWFSSDGRLLMEAGTAEASARMGAKLDFGTVNVYMSHFNVQMYGNVAVATFYLVGTHASGGVTKDGTWRVTAVWVRKGDKWKEAHHHESPLMGEIHP